MATVRTSRSMGKKSSEAPSYSTITRKDGTKVYIGKAAEEAGVAGKAVAPITPAKQEAAPPRTTFSSGVSYEQALQNLRSGGLTGDTLAQAEQSLKGAYAVQQTTTNLRNGFNEDSQRLDERLTRGQQGAADTTTITKDVDNGDGTRTVTYSDGSTARVKVTKGADGSESYTEIEDAEDVDESDPYGLKSQVSRLEREAKRETEKTLKELDRLAAQMDSASVSLISAIKSSYQGRIAEMHEANKRLFALKRTQGIREGRSRYLQGVEAGILTDEEQAGIGRIAALRGEMLTAVAQAQYARAENKMKAFSDRMKRIDELDKKLKDEISDLWDRAQKAEQAQRERSKAALDAQKASLDLMTKRAEKAAPAVSEALDRFATPEEQQAFLDEYSRRTGVDMDILLGEINLARRDAGKAELEQRNIRSQISTRESQEARERRKETFNPSAEQRATVGKYLAKFGTDEDRKKADTDPDFFFYILDKAEEEE